MVRVIIFPEATSKPPKYTPSKTTVAEIETACAVDNPDYRKLAEYYVDLSHEKYKNAEELKQKVFDTYTAPLRKKPAQKQETLLSIAARSSGSMTRQLLSSYRLSFSKNDMNWALREAAQAAQVQSCQALVNYGGDLSFTSKTISEDILSLALYKYQTKDPHETVAFLCDQGMKPSFEHIRQVSELSVGHRQNVMQVLLQHADDDLAAKSFAYFTKKHDLDSLALWGKSHQVSKLPPHIIKISIMHLNAGLTTWEKYEPPASLIDKNAPEGTKLSGYLGLLSRLYEREDALLKQHQAIKQHHNEAEKHPKSVKRVKKNLADMFQKISQQAKDDPIIRTSKKVQKANTPQTPKR